MDDETAPAWKIRVAALGAAALVLLVAYAFGVFPFGGDDTAEQLSTGRPQPSVVVTAASEVPATVDSTSGATSTVTPTTVTPTTSAADDTATTTTVTTTATSEALEPAASDPAASTSAAPAEPDPATYPTLPDGRPVPVLAIFDGELITLSGTVPSESAAQRLRVLALANSTVPDAEVASLLAVEPTVPLGVGVRVIEMNSARFPEGSATVSPEHAAQLDRVATIMTALPNITVEVIGHADQRGDDEANFTLSAARARAATDYVASQGVDPNRLSSRGAGESDLLTLNNDEAALALNRRTEFVFSGLLVDASDSS